MVSSKPAPIIIGLVIARLRCSCVAPAARARSLASPTCVPTPPAVPAAIAPLAPPTAPPTNVATPPPRIEPRPDPTL